MTFLLLFVAAFVGGALNSVAGGGSFIALPALMSAGVAPVAANATSTLALWPGSASSALAYRREVVTMRSWLTGLGLASLVGGLAGGWLLIRTSDERFLQLLPWLMLAAAVTFTFGGQVTARLRAMSARRSVTGAPSHPAPPHPRTIVPPWLLGFQFVIATYGGYFGGGMGIMMLAALAVAGLDDIHEMNGIKTTLAVLINGVALVAFVVSGVIAWKPGLIMVAGGILGGYGGAALARRLNPSRVRTFVVAIAWIMTAYFFYR